MSCEWWAAKLKLLSRSKMQNCSTAVFLTLGLWTVTPTRGFVYRQSYLFIALDRLDSLALDSYKKWEEMWSVLAHWSQHASAFVCWVACWKRWLIVSLCEVLKRCSLRLFVFMQKFFFFIIIICFRAPFWGEAPTPARRRARDVSRPIISDITFVEKHFLLSSPSESSTVIGSPREFPHMDYLSAKRSAPADTSRNLSGNRWEKAGLDSLRHPTCLPARFSFNVWPRVKMAASSTGRLEVNPSNLVGHGRLLLFSLRRSNHLFGACGQGKRNGEPSLVLLRLNHSLQRVLCFLAV